MSSRYNVYFSLGLLVIKADRGDLSSDNEREKIMPSKGRGTVWSTCHDDITVSP